VKEYTETLVKNMPRAASRATRVVFIGGLLFQRRTPALLTGVGPSFYGEPTETI
jgi:hypothetical protein